MIARWVREHPSLVLRLAFASMAGSSLARMIGAWGTPVASWDALYAFVAVWGLTTDLAGPEERWTPLPKLIVCLHVFGLTVALAGRIARALLP